MKLRSPIDPISLVLGTVMGIQFIIMGLYSGLLVWPFYSNGLHMQPSAKVASSSFEPTMLAPFCHTPPDAPIWGYSRCADGSAGNPWGDELRFAAMQIALWGPILLIMLGILVGVNLVREWSALRLSARVVGLVHVGMSLGALGFLGITGLGPLLLFWIRD